MKLTDDLLQSLYDGLFEQPLWSVFLDRLQRHSEVNRTVLVIRDLRRLEDIRLAAGNGRRVGEGDEAGLQWMARNLLEPTMRDGRVYALEDLTAQMALSGLDGEGEKGRFVRVVAEDGFSAGLCCVGGRRGNWAGVGALLRAVAPHLRTVLRIYSTLEQERFRSALSVEAFQRLDLGWITLDSRCRILDMTPHLEPFFQRTDILRRGRYDRLTPASPAIDRELGRAIGEFVRNPNAPPRTINLSRDPLIDMIVRPVQKPLGGQSAPIAIVGISGDRWSNADRCQQLVELFDLLPSEARLAWALAQGLSIARAAEELGLTTGTARNYSKRIYAKMGVNGQAELVRNILTSVLAFA